MDYGDDTKDDDGNGESDACSDTDNVHTALRSLESFAGEHLPTLSEDIREFAEARLWARYHKPRNLILALLGEAGELAEVLQWDGDDDDDEGGADTRPTIDPSTLDKLSQELADVSIYAIRLATVCGVVGGLGDSLLVRATGPPTRLFPGE